MTCDRSDEKGDILQIQVMKKAFKCAFPYTIPIFAGFWFLGLTYGIYMNVNGFSFLYPMLMSLTIFAGSIEFIAVNMLMGAFDPLQAFAMTLMINARHLFYGIAMLDRFRGMGWKKIYLIFGMCDETFSINCSAEIPPEIDRGWFYFFVTLLNQLYWVGSATLGGLLGSLIETVTGECLEAVYQREVFVPLEMNATLDVTQADKEHTLPISRVLPYRAKRAWQVEAAAEKSRPLAQPDPLHHFGYAAGSLYTDAASLDHFLTMLVQHGEYQGQCYLSSASIDAMTTAHASYGSIAPTLAYGLGLLLINDPALSPRRILGHQGFAYGCVNGAFYEEGTGRRVILLNGGASEARMGRLGRINRDILRWALREDNDAWT